MISLSSKTFKIDNIETVLFDKDGTFIDLHYFWGQMTELRVKEIIKKYHLKQEYFEKLCLCLGYNPNNCKMLSDGITAMYSRSKIIDIFRQDLKSFDVYISDIELEQIFDEVSEIFYQDMQKYTKPIESAILFIKNLRKTGMKIGIVTSDSTQSTLLTLKHFGWKNLFDVVIGRESCSQTKESGFPTKMALELLSANPNTTVMIGDAPMDYISAKNAGIEKTILVATGQIDSSNLKKTSEYVVENLEEVQIIN
ncbi:MAG: HAD family hydrolase [Cyanobacteria bacterium SIG29]|nr:HAD family hydrolase [Cyanobacteria bacterium SIG29]